ncbi:hypothetical protein Pmani_037588 [Petrolisthes manimaculis]|uniref:Uncharacterized protein n=1 Tax=Petrolisthes manimaculis TaxID=1843537 RepID=A0AAE1NHX1_9EUCA|nr:hypothetical protein Pmani_037588 [Petrolisthes manimaculis]
MRPEIWKRRGEDQETKINREEGGRKERQERDRPVREERKITRYRKEIDEGRGKGGTECVRPFHDPIPDAWLTRCKRLERDLG